MKYVLPKSPRFCSIFLVIFLVFLLIFPGVTPVQAVSSAVISIDKTSVTPGGTTVVTVKVQGIQAPGLAGYDFKITYDPAVVNLVGLSRTSDFPAPTAGFAAPQPNPSKVPGEILVNAAQTSGTTGDIELFNLTFQALSTTDQVSPLTLTVNDEGFAYADLSDIPYTINNGSITIGSASTPSLSVSPAMLSESSTNDGSLLSGDITLTLANGTFATDIGKSDITIAVLPDEMDFTVSRTSDTTLKVTVTGEALSHDNTNDTTLALTVAQAKVIGATANITGTIGLDFNSNGIANAITDFSKTTLESTSANFAWTAAVGATALWVQQSTDNGVTWVDSTTDQMPLSCSATSAKVLNLVPGAPYLFKLEVRGGENAGVSNVVSFTMPQTNTPAAPTVPVVDDIMNTFGWNNVVGYSDVTNYEYSVDNGQTWLDCTANPQPVGNHDFSVGFVQVRIKADALTNRFAGSVLGSDLTFMAVLYGDCNGDGNINAQDITLLRRVVAQVAGYHLTITGAGDVNRDGNTNAQDITLLRRVVAQVSGYTINQQK